MTTGMMQDQSLEKHMKKQMGCMTGFLQIFDRHQLLTGKRLYTKRLPAAKGGSTSPETEKSDTSPEIPEETEKPKPTRTMTSPSPDRYKSPSTELRTPAPASPLPAETPPKSSLPHPIFELNEATKYSWKFNKETPRLSLDSRATFDAAKGSLYPNRCNNSGDGSDDKSRRSTSVIARLMGLESLPNSSPSEPIIKQAELRRSASESRVSRDIFQNRLSENNNNYQQKQQNLGNHITSNVIRERNVDPVNSTKSLKIESAKASNRGFKSPQQRKSFFDSADFFPEPKQTTVSIYGEIERRLKMKGMDEQSQDLETLKQILEAMQLKGLLHTKKPSTQVRNKNIVYERNHSFPSNEEQSPIVLMRPGSRRVGNDSPPSSNYRSKLEYRRSDSIPAVSPRRSVPDRSMKSPTRVRNASSPTRSENNVKNSNVRRNQLNSETHSRVIESPEHRRMSPINSPRRRNVSDQIGTNRSITNRKSTTQIHPKNKISTTFMIEDESSSAISESTVSTPSQTDTERCKSEEFKEGKSLLERCDKLLQSIADMNATELQPSPVSVLDSSFYKDDSLSPSPVMKRTISFTDESEEEIGSLEISSVHSKTEDEIDDGDYIYISEILRASSYLTEEADIFWFVEKQKYCKGKENSRDSRLQRKLIFDNVIEIINQNKQIPSWKAYCTRNTNTTPELSVRHIWTEIRRIQELNNQTTDLFGIVCGVLKKDLAGNGWGDFPVEMSEAVLDIERLIFKDLIGESIRDLAVSAGNCSFLAPRRKLVF